MNNKVKRILLFLLGCMTARFGIAWLAYSYPVLLPYMAIIAVIISLSFMIIYVGGYRKTGAEVFGDKIWWNNLRPIHATNYLVFAILALSKTYSHHAWKVLFLDASIGLIAFSHYHLT